MMIRRLLGFSSKDADIKRKRDLEFSMLKKFDLVFKIKDLDFVAACRALANDRSKAKVKDADGYLPMHLCLLNRGPERLIGDLIDAYPGALLQRDPSGKLPFHIICKDNSCLLTYVQFVLQACPQEALGEKDPLGDLPLHMTIRYRCPKETTLLVMGAYPVATQAIDKDGNTPLHLALRFGCEQPLVFAILETYPEAVRVRNKKKDLPIHRAALFNAALPVLQALAKQNPESLAEIDANGNLPIHLYFMQMRGGRPTDDVLSFFLESYPGALGVKNKAKCTPLMILENYYEQLQEYMY